MNNIIDELFQKVQTLGNNFTANTYQALSQSMGPVFTLMFVLYLIFWGYSFWQGRGEASASGMALRLLRVFVIYTIATSWGDFQTVVYTVANETPDAVGTIIIQNIGNAGGTGASNTAIEQALSNVYLTGVDAASKLTGNAGWTNPGPYIYGALVWVSVALFVGFSAFVVIFSKIMLWVLLSLAPIFIVLLLFNVSSRFFNGWLAATVQNIIVPVIVYALLGFFLSIIKDAVQTLNNANAGSATTLKEIAPVVLAGFIGLFIMSQVINLAALLAGGAPFGIPTFARFAAVASRPFRNVVRNSAQEISTATGNTRAGRLRALRRDAIDSQFRALQDRRAAVSQQLKNR
jgi:type IV secretion system protein VirB6